MKTTNLKTKTIAVILLLIAAAWAFHQIFRHSNSKATAVGNDTTVSNLPVAGTRNSPRSKAADFVTNAVILPTSSPPIHTGRSYYLAPRTDGKEGSGTFNDPWDASDATKLSGLWSRISYSLTRPQGGVITFLPGIYYCTNDMQFADGTANLTLSGYGAKIMFTGPITGQHGIFYSMWWGNNNVVVQGFELDCGTLVTNANKPGNVCGVTLFGRNNVIRDVTIRNIYTSGGGLEAFGIILKGTNCICSGNIIDGLAGTNVPYGGTAIVIEGEANTASGNAVNLRDNDHSELVTTFAYSCYGSRNVIMGNVCSQVDAGISMDGGGGYEDGHPHKENIILGNQFLANSLAVRIENYNQTFNNWLWVGNNFNAGLRWLSMWTADAWRSNRISGHSFIGNKFTGKPSLPYNLATQNFTNHTFIGNDFSIPPKNLLGTNANTIYGAGNTVDGVPNNSAFGVKQ